MPIQQVEILKDYVLMFLRKKTIVFFLFCGVGVQEAFVSHTSSATINQSLKRGIKYSLKNNNNVYCNLFGEIKPKKNQTNDQVAVEETWC